MHANISSLALQTADADGDVVLQLIDRALAYLRNWKYDVTIDDD